MAVTGLVVRHLTVSYGTVPALRDVTFAAGRGAVTGLIGPNGAGKSTAVKAILGLLPTDAGTISVDDRPPREARRHVAYLPQRSATDPDYPAQVRDVVAMGRLPHVGLWGRLRVEHRRAVTQAMRRLGLQDLERRQLGRLSGGQQQRAHLARALAQQPAFYLLDEPFAGIDAPTIALLVRVLRDLADAGAGVLVVNHDLDLLDGLCDHVVLLNRTVLAEGTVSAVLTSPALRHAYGLEANRGRSPHP